MNMPVRAKGLSLVLNEKKILEDVSFELETGDFLSVIGRNGAGKSSLLKCLSGLYKNFSGELTIGGNQAGRLRSAERARLIAYVPQGTPDEVPYTVREFLSLSRYPWLGSESRSQHDTAIEHALELTGTAAIADRKLSQLSGGERQSALLAGALAQGTPMILMDEPTTYLDYAHQAKSARLLAEINRNQGITMMVVTHDVNLAMKLSSRIIALADGNVLWKGSAAELRETEILRKIYGIGFEEYRSQRGTITAPADIAVGCGT